MSRPDDGQAYLIFIFVIGIFSIGCVETSEAPDYTLESGSAPSLLPPLTESPASSSNQNNRGDTSQSPSASPPPGQSGPVADEETQDPSMDDEIQADENAQSPEPSESETEGMPMGSSEAPCMGLDYIGRCSGDVSEWCDPDNTLQTLDCAAMNQSCGWVDEQIGWYCGGDPNGGPDTEQDTPNGAPEELPDGPANPCGSDIEAEVVELANESRADEGLDALECDADMTRAARLHSQDMCDEGYFSHSSLDGRTPWDRMRAQGVQFGRGAENIAQGQGNPASVHSSWMNSPGHRANILTGGLRRIGVGFVDCNGNRYWTEVFAD